MRKRSLGIAVLAILLVGCGIIQKHVNHPGSANTFDSDSYDTLLVTDSVIKTTKDDLAANAFPASIAGNVKTALNDLIRAYDIADTVYCGAPITTATGLQCTPESYHGAAIAGKATATQSNAVSLAISNVNAKTSALTAAKAGK